AQRRQGEPVRVVDLERHVRRARRHALTPHPDRRRPARRARSAQGAGGRSEVSLLEVGDLSVYFGPRKVVDSASFTLDAGEKLALVGESASGKTVTALSTLRLVENARLTGSIRFDGREVLAMSPRELHEIRG